MTAVDLATTPGRGMQAGRIPLSFQLRNLLAVRGPVIPPAERAIVTDLSFWEGNVNFDTMKAAGAKATYIKCTQGTTIFDSKYLTYLDYCDNMPMGDYHYLTQADGTTQANWYLAHLRQPSIGFVHVVDVEVDMLDSAIIYYFVVRVKTVLNLPEYPLIYTSAYKWSLVTGTHKAWLAANCKLIVAHYGVDAPLMPTGWTDYVMHQYADNGDGHAYGCESAEVDLNRCRKSWLEQYHHEATVEERVTELEAWARTEGYQG